jgi:hypothetical protein
MPSVTETTVPTVAGLGILTSKLLDTLFNQIADFRRVQLLHDGILKD